VTKSSAAPVPSPGAPAPRRELDTEIAGWMREAGDAGSEASGSTDDARFAALARKLFTYQYEHCAPYRRFCDGRGVAPANLDDWTHIPAVPTGAFKEVALRTFPAEDTLRTFRTSGTAVGKRGELHLDTLALYDASLLPTFRRFVLPELEAGGSPLPIRVLAPPPEELEDSSLSHMFGRVVVELGATGSGFDVEQGELLTKDLIARLQRIEDENTPILLCGTAFAFVHLVDALTAQATELSLPEGSRIMETGGFKGRSRELERSALEALLERSLGVAPGRVVNQYGMTELGSQFYDSNLRYPEQPRCKLGPPWARVLIIDPETREPADPGDPGIVTIYDLANTGSVLAVETADLGRQVGRGFEIIGREPGAEARGCSIAADELLVRGGA
jgi:hypothetical protein